MDPFREHVPARRRLPIAWKFSGLLAVLVPALIGVSWIGGRALGVIKDRLDAVYEDSLATSRLPDDRGRPGANSSASRRGACSPATFSP